MIYHVPLTHKNHATHDLFLFSLINREAIIHDSSPFVVIFVCLCSSYQIVGVIIHGCFVYAERDESRLIRLVHGTKKRKESVTKTGSENASDREKNRDKTVVFTLTCGRFSLFRRSKHSFCVVKAALLHAESSPFSL